MKTGSIVELTDKTFRAEILEGPPLALVDFWAEWCVPCKMFLPTLQELANEYAGKLTVGQINLDVYRNIAMWLHVQSLPTLILFQNGEAVRTLTGPQQKAKVKDYIDELID
ncbi:MAG: thioredoxin [Planctomycetota bacterium]|nr:thioredoxin [Planctomycetota bacterium]